MKQKVELPKC